VQRPRSSVTRAGIGPTAFDAIVRSLPGTKVVTRDDSGALTEPWRGTRIGRPDSVLPESADQETVEPAVDDAGLGSGVQARSGDVSIGDAVFERISRGPCLLQAAATQEDLTRHALESGRARFVPEMLRHRRPCGRSPGSQSGDGADDGALSVGRLAGVGPVPRLRSAEADRHAVDARDDVLAVHGDDQFYEVCGLGQSQPSS
jgi:hypothetical protein